MSAMNIMEEEGIWFVYDGECPLCKNAALAFRIQEKYGRLHLLNARTTGAENPLIREINARGYDLDEGMVLYDGTRFFHGRDALQLIARVGKKRNLFGLVNKSLWWSDFLSELMYPWMRGFRNLLLRWKKVGRIDNLKLREEPTFKPVFGEDWDRLPAVMRKHYSNRPYTDDVTRAEGYLDVSCTGPIKWLSPVIWLMRGIPPANKKNVRVSVDFESDQNVRSFALNRVFHFKGRKPYRFKSRLIPIQDNEVVELMSSRLGWRSKIVWQDGRVNLIHKGYVLFAFGHLIPLPLTMLLGKAYGQESPVDDESFDMSVDITHPWWGKIYEYKGRIRMQDADD